MDDTVGTLSTDFGTAALTGGRLLCVGDVDDAATALHLFGEAVHTLHLLTGPLKQDGNLEPSSPCDPELTQQLERSGWMRLGPGIAVVGTGAEGALVAESAWQRRGQDHNLRVVMDQRDLGAALDGTGGPLAVFVGGPDRWRDETWSRWPGFYRVLDRLMDGGLLVIRGAGTAPRSGRVYRRHRPLFDAKDYAALHGWNGLIGVEFRNVLGLRFRCVDCVGEADERHVIWQVRRT